jgi:hypothetical protein
LMLGPGPTHRGGRIGRWFDNTLRKIAFQQATIRHELEFAQYMGYTIPPLAEHGANQVGVHVLLHSWLAQVLMRTKFRRHLIQKYTNISDTATRVNQKGQCIPRIIIQPNVGDWYRPIAFETAEQSVPTKENSNFTVLVFDNEQINDFMMYYFEKLYTHVYPKLSVLDQIQLFGIAAASVMGGLFLSPEIRNLDSFHTVTPGMLSWINHTEHCDVERPPMWLQVDPTTQDIIAIVVSPNHPQLHCALETLTTHIENEDFSLHSLISMIHERKWDPTCKNTCCPLQEGMVQRQDRDNNNNNNNNNIRWIISDQTLTKPWKDRHIDHPRFFVEIHEREGNVPYDTETKKRCGDRLRQRKCSAGWFCHRCLKTPYAGTLDRCLKYCRSCYSEMVCTIPSRTTAIIDVVVKETSVSQQKRIPRIIHQTYFETLTTARYPHLQRLQNSWKASGWDYRFYSDKDCHEYIQRNYPARFVEAYDSILPGAFKADFFRLLVLFKDGGIYSDIDVQLETDLDSFITTDLSLFVPRDVPLDYWPNSNYCLWNGLLGSAPGHPIIAKALEDVVTTIQNRHDYYDVEGSLCSKHPYVAIWKLRTLPILILTGPCALGMSMNTALGNSDVLAGFEIGWLNAHNLSMGYHQPTDYFWGDVMTLLTDRYDIGELRFTDMDRNLLVASTNQDRFAKAPIEYTITNASKESVHYSKSDTDIVGEYRVYKDDIVTNQNVKLLIQHNYA